MRQLILADSLRRRPDIFAVDAEGQNWLLVEVVDSADDGVEDGSGLNDDQMVPRNHVEEVGGRRGMHMAGDHDVMKRVIADGFRDGEGADGLGAVMRDGQALQMADIWLIGRGLHQLLHQESGGRLAPLPSFDVYSLRRTLRERGIPVNNFADPKLSEEKNTPPYVFKIPDAIPAGDL